MISRHHANRQAHNWLVYDIGDRFLEQFVPLYKGVLYDLGAGEAPYREFFTRHSDKYVTVDWSGSQHPIQADIVADLNEPLPVASGVADTVVSLSVLEHLREPGRMLAEAHRILRPGGAIVLQVPWQWWVHEAPHDFYRYTPYALEHLLRTAGFVDVTVHPQAGFFTTMTLKANYFSCRLVRGPAPVRLLLRAVFSVFWFAGQKLAPLLDRLDDDWALEACGYYVTARRN
ncbi:class I SAM-dependent methyltransferase [Ramlibacter sp. RBP-2]|uniref:Class I SAM-dependent methyltransferase n=1 Tax=Ramlibacter lithotrophicus TaxID=2606681 RepID=A0A7X6DKB0_9BURK|nr:class I SAM-dependent methyltransferase [Ramlibacter lithotrophicus]NKE68735.1 class I SAM-dependent methyltransferase [Ramlibacter lithotrophicus]